MTDELQPVPEERLPATRPPEQLAAERFTAAPPIRATDGLTPERSAAIVRQSSSARWIAFLGTCVVVLFVIGYWFYELGLPLGLSQPRLEQEIEHQQVVAVERGYNVYQANCARCHGPTGLGLEDPNAAEAGYIGPALNDQEKLFAHLNENYLRNVLEVGGRYVCGNPNSQMPAWADTGNPPGPLNYRQIDELIAFLRAPSDQTFVVKDPALNEPMIDPETGEELTFTGWRDPNFVPAPGSTPVPDCWLDAIGGGGDGSPAPGGSLDPDAPVITVTAPVGAATTGFEPEELEAPADTAFGLEFVNDDPVQHNVVIKDADGTDVPMGDTSFFTGPETRVYPVEPLEAGDYSFVCVVHPTTMTGTLTVE
ncbi:MAG TPA: cupredoxin domain-containing protein [Candidatus Limnocylindrales bacterium]|nr:cupredoxin domain-containing protein [Candidatus Limnocylindrales bacterium]